MKATITTKETKNGTRYIHSIDGKVVRTANRPMEYVCVAIKDGETNVKCLGNLKTCNAAISDAAIELEICKAMRDMFAGKITYKEYYNRVGFAHAMIPSFFREEMNEWDNTKKNVDFYTEAVERLSGYTFAILKF